MSETEKPAKKPRKKYEPPAVISEEVFETLALSCALSSPIACRGSATRS